MNNLKTRQMASAVRAPLAAILLAAIGIPGCGKQLSATGTFDRTFSVNGPVRLELMTGSGDAHVTTGPAGEVRIHGVIHARSWSEESAQKRVDELAANPPVGQEGNLVRAGDVGLHLGDVSVDYTIIVPIDTEIKGKSGSGDLTVGDTHGPASFACGSGDISASNIVGDVTASAGSGDVKVDNVQGQVQVSTGSGDIQITNAKGQTRLNSGSGDIQITRPGDAVEAGTGSGDVQVKGATADLRLHSSSGTVTVDGNPGPTNYWDFRTSSGDVTLRVPSEASFRLYAKSSSGDIDAAIPVVMEGTAGKHELRARIGDGKARVEVETSSGQISLH
jgi:hypothetical protein